MKRIYILLIASFFLLFNGCTKTLNSEDSDGELSSNISFDYSDVIDYHLEWMNILSLDGKYFTYIYSPTCMHCHEIKEDMIEARLINNINIYYIKYNKDIEIVDDRDKLTGVDDVANLAILGTPSMFEIEEHKTKKYYAGKTEILNALSNLYDV